MFYAFFIQFARFLLDQFYKSIETRGEPLGKSEPVLFLANHPNTMMDPLLLGTSAGRPVCFLAKATLFRSWALGALLKALDVLPVYRKQDFPDAELSELNAKIFETAVNSLADGKAVALFPEGVSRSTRVLGELKTGAARIALAYKEKTGRVLKIQTVGIQYEAFARFRSSVALVFGEPFTEEQLEGEGFELARNLTSHIREELLGVSHSLEQARNEWLAELISVFYSQYPDAMSQVERMQLIRRGLEELVPEYRAEARSLEASLESYFSFSAASPQLFSQPLGRFLALLLISPAAYLGRCFNLIPYKLVAKYHRLGSPYPAYAASSKLVFGLLIYGLWYIGSLLLAILAFDEFGAAAWALAGLCVLLARSYWEEICGSVALRARLFASRELFVEALWRESLRERIEGFREILTNQSRQ